MLATVTKTKVQVLKKGQKIGQMELEDGGLYRRPHSLTPLLTLLILHAVTKQEKTRGVVRCPRTGEKYHFVAEDCGE